MTREHRSPSKREDGKLGSLRLVRETIAQIPRDDPSKRVRCATPLDVQLFMQPHADREATEVFWILAVDSQHRVIFNEPIVITRGTINSSLVHPREVFRAAIVAGAAAVILVHNHPSGDPTPSADDRAVTRQLVEAGRLLDLPVHDHVVMGRSAYVSFAEMGLL